jgi:hypothetical protein
MPDTIRPALTEDDLVRMEHRARRFQGAWTGTSGTLAADVMRLLAERLRLLELLAEAHGKH